MFGSSNAPGKDDDSSEAKSPTAESPKVPGITIPNNDSPVEKSPDSPMGRKSGEQGEGGDKRGGRRASGVAKARDMVKNAFTGSPTRTTAERVIQTPIQKLSKTDPALGVPQGALNNAAGESAPGPRSTFRVGVTEDKNKKCRRTMEDTHAYLYNFLSTPAPSLDLSPKKTNSSLETVSSHTSASSNRPVVETDNGYFAIFDGHAGTFAAEWCGKKLHLLLEDVIRKNPNKAIPELLDETFTSVDQQLEKLPLKNSGCTAVIAVLRWEDRIPNPQSATGSTSLASAAAAAAAKEGSSEGAVTPTQSGESGGSQKSSSNGQSAAPGVEAKIRESASRQRVLYTANVGDARIVLCRNGKALRLSYDHKGSDDNEGRRIANAGGLILNNRVNGVLAVTRALGDAYMKDLVTGHPYTTETVIQPDIDEFLILACDGLWDVCTDQEAVDLVRHVQDPQPASKMLVDHALAHFSTDNLSCMIVRFNPRAVVDTVERRSGLEPIGVDGDPASLVKGGVSEAEAIVTAARKNLSAEGLAPPPDAASDDELTRVSTEMTGIVEEAAADQEPGPELDADALEQAREKAKEGQTLRPDAATSDAQS